MEFKCCVKVNDDFWLYNSVANTSKLDPRIIYSVKHKRTLMLSHYITWYKYARNYDNIILYHHQNNKNNKYDITIINIDLFEIVLTIKEIFLNHSYIESVLDMKY